MNIRANCSEAQMACAKNLLYNVNTKLLSREYEKNTKLVMALVPAALVPAALVPARTRTRACGTRAGTHYHSFGIFSYALLSSLVLSHSPLRGKLQHFKFKQNLTTGPCLYFDMAQS